MKKLSNTKAESLKKACSSFQSSVAFHIEINLYEVQHQAEMGLVTESFFPITCRSSSSATTFNYFHKKLHFRYLKWLYIRHWYLQVLQKFRENLQNFSEKLFLKKQSHDFIYICLIWLYEEIDACAINYFTAEVPMI